MANKEQIDRLLSLIDRYRTSGIDSQIDYSKFYLYSIITHSTAIEGSTVTEIENQMLFDQGLTASGRTVAEQMMNLDLKAAYEESISLAGDKVPVTVMELKNLARLVMKNTGSSYRTALGEFSSADGDLRLLNVTAGAGGKSYLSYSKVPAALEEFCRWLNEERTKELTVPQRYCLSFDAHYYLVTIHPWADGNGRMARLLMNHIQFEAGLIPTKVFKEDKGEYIKTLVQTRESGNLDIFRDFMLEETIKSIDEDLKSYRQSTEDPGLLGEAGFVPRNYAKPQRGKKEKSREIILRLLSFNPKMTTRTLAEETGISIKAVEKHLARLKKDGLLKREGSDRNGKWEVIG